MKVIRDLKKANKLTTGTSLSGYIDATYSQLVQVLGEPTFNEASGDGKVQVEWVVKFEGEVFTIYDWKTFDREYTLNGLDRFNVGSKGVGSLFIAALEEKLKDEADIARFEDEDFGAKDMGIKR